MPLLHLDVSLRFVQNIKLVEHLARGTSPAVRAPRMELTGEDKAGVEAVVATALKNGRISRATGCSRGSTAAPPAHLQTTLKPLTKGSRSSRKMVLWPVIQACPAIEGTIAL